MDAGVLARPDRQLRGLVGLVDHPAYLHRPDLHPAAHVQGREVDAAAADVPARDQEDPGALQGRQAAHEPGGHGLLPAREGQSAGVVPAADPADPVLHRAVPAPAVGPVQGGHRRQPGLLLHRQPGREGDRTLPARRVDRPLRRHPAGGQPGHRDQRGSHSAADHARAALRVRDLHRQLRSRPDRLLDHDQRLDHRPAAAREEALSQARARHRGRGRAGGPGARQAGGQTRRRRGSHRRRAEGRRCRRRYKVKSRKGKGTAKAADGDGAAATSAGNGARAKPPPSPRKKKKRSGRRR